MSCDTRALALHACSTSSFHLEQKSEHEIQSQIIHIGQGSEFWQLRITPSSTVIWTSPKAVALTNVTICHVSDLREQEIPTFKHPKHVEEIHFDGFISQKNFDILVLPLTNLKLLEVHISSLEHLSLTRRMGFLTYLQLPNLESLQISSYHFTPDHAANSDIDKIIINCCSLVRKLFPSLNFLAVSLPLVRHREDQITESILKSLKTHRRTLKSLNVESTFEVELIQRDEASLLHTVPNLDLELTTLKEIQLQSFHYFSTHKTQGTTFWRKFLQTQRNLEYLQFWCGKKYYSIPTILILNNFRNLHTIALNINPLIGTFRGVRKNSVDCTVFHRCSLLRTLVLKGNPKHTQPDPPNKQRKSDLANFNLVPKGLQHIRLIHLGLKKKDARLIAREMHSLSVLYLEDIGDDHGLGLALEDLAYLLGKKSVSTLDVHGGMNKKSFSETSDETTGGFCTIAKILFKTHNPQSFRAILDGGGEYDIVDSIGFDEEEAFEEQEIFHQHLDDEFENDVAQYVQSIGILKVSISEEEDSFQHLNMNLNEYNNTNGSIKSIELPTLVQPHRSGYLSRRQNKMTKHPKLNYSKIIEEGEKLSGSSSDEEVLDFSPPSSSTKLRDAQTETDIEIYQPNFRFQMKK